MSSTFSSIYLASRSPRRGELLKQIGVPFVPLLFRGASREDTDAREDILEGEDAKTYVMRIARLKAQAGILRVQWRKLPALPILSADTTLEMDGQIIGKPVDIEDATRILKSLSGRTHTVLTAVVLAYGGVLHERLSVSTVRMGTISDSAIEAYISTGEPFDKAGAYGIQGAAGAFISEIHGSYSGIMGLPLFETTELLQELTSA